MEFMYQMLCGKSGAEGFLRWVENGRELEARGLQPGSECALYALMGERGKKCAAFQPDVAGKARVSTQEQGMLFAAAGEKVVLWEDGDEGYLKASAFLDRERVKHREQAKEKETPPEEKPLEGEEPVEPAPFPQEEPAKEESGEKEETTAAAAYSLRSPGTGEAVDALPELIWPEGAKEIQGYFEQFPRCAPFSAPGWRFVRAAPPAPGIPFCAVGYLARDGRVREIAFAVPAVGRQPLPGYTLLPGQDGFSYWVSKREV